MPRLAWVTGAGGLIGSYIARTPPLTGDWCVRPLARPELDVCDAAAVRKAFDAERPDLIVHCAALSQSPACEANPALARRINTEATQRLAELAADILFIFFSTDLVFDGATGRYTEEAPVHPLSVYAETKAAAEAAVLANPRHTVIRTSLTAGISPTGDRGFNEQLRRAWSRGQVTRLFVDEFRNPLHASVTARVVWEIAHRALCGLFHVAGTERLSRWEIGQRLGARWPELAPRLEAGSLKDYVGPPRSPDTSLDCGKIQKHLSFRLPGFTEWLQLNHDAAVV